MVNESTKILHLISFNSDLLKPKLIYALNNVTWNSSSIPRDHAVHFREKV